MQNLLQNNWQTKKLGEICKVFNDGDWIEKKDQSTEGIRLIQTGNIGIGVFKDRGEKSRYISETTYKRLRCTEILPGDCLISRLPDPVGRACIIPEMGGKMITAVDCTIIRFDNSKILPRYFIYYSQCAQYLNSVNHETTGTTRRRISRKNLGLIEILHPESIAEQKRIVKILNGIFEKIEKAKENAERNLQNSRELFESYLEDVFLNTREGWKVLTIAEICTIKHGFAFKSKYFSNKGDYVLLTPGNFYESGGYRDRGNKQKYYIGTIPDGYILQKDDFLIAMTEQAPGLLGSPIIIPESNKFLHNQRLGLIVFFKSLNINKKFFYYLFNTIRIRNEIYMSSSGVKVRHTSPSKVSSIKIFIPNLNQQKIIVKKLDGLAGHTRKLEEIYKNKLADLEELKKSVLQKAFNGEM